MRVAGFPCSPERRPSPSAYLEYKRGADLCGLNAEEINAALDNFWRDRAAKDPTHQAVRQHLKEEAEYVKDIEIESVDKR
jgi:hypothetical protein